MAVMVAVEAKMVAALMVRVSLLAVPSTELPSALKILPLLTVTAALAVMVAPAAKVVTALTCSV